MLRTYRYRLYPNKVQREQIRKNIDACRFVYNWALEQKKLAYETWKMSQLVRPELFTHKSETRPFLSKGSLLSVPYTGH